MITRSHSLLPGQRETWRWWLTMAIASLAMIAAVAAGLLAVGRSDAIGLAVITAGPMAAGIVSGRRQTHDRERSVVGTLEAGRQRAALAAYAGREIPDDPVVAADAVRLMLTVLGDARVYLSLTPLPVAAVGGGFTVAAVLASAWWWADAAFCFLFAIFVLWRLRRLNARLRLLKSRAAWPRPDQQLDP